MDCPGCQAANPDDAKFCMSCGTPLSSVCPKCATDLPSGAKFCFSCGAQLTEAPAATSAPRHAQYIPEKLRGRLEAARSGGAMRGERRVVTMLFCDVMGSTAAAEQLDPEEWTEIMNGAYEHLIAPVYRYEGTLARLMGDAVLAIFGAPIAHEDDPERAVLASLDIVEGVQEYKHEVERRWSLDFDVRIGINTGLVVVGEVGSDLHVEYTALGDAINLAARMEQTAEPGTIQVSANTYRYVRALFDVAPLGPIELKGKAEPVEAYRVLAARAQPGRTRGIEGLDAPMIGRNEEMSVLRAAVAELRKGRGQIVSVMGEAGLGKSRLVAELRKSLVADGSLARADGVDDSASPSMVWHEGRSYSYESSTPYAPFARLLNGYFRMEDGYQSGSHYDVLREQIAGLLPGRASETAPFIATLLGFEPTGEDRERVKYLQPPQLRGQIFKAAGDLFEALASACPLLVVFEDIHWIDPPSLDLLEELMALTDRMPLMLLAVLRPQRQEASWRFHDSAQRDYTHRYTSVALEPLDADNSRTLVANLLHVEDLPLKVRNLILTKAEGNPFFVEEVIRSLLDAELVVQQNSHWRATQEIENISVPDTLAGVINARLDRLDDGSKQGALTASVIGREFDFDTLADVHDVGHAIDSVLTDLQRRELIREQSRQPHRVYLFKHALTQETAYASLLMSRRRELHLRVAEYMERVAPERVNELARHFLEAREDERALPYVVEAGELAAKAYSTADAIARYSRALEILEAVENPQLARRAYEGLGGALTSAFDVQGAIDNYQSMLAKAQAEGDMPMQVSALNKIAFVTGLMQGQTVKADEHLITSERLANECSDFAGLSELHTIYCYIKTAHAEFDEAYGHLAEAAEIGERLNLEEPRLFGLVHTANTLTYMTRFDEAWEAAEEARQVAEELGNRKWQAELMALTTPFYHMRNGDLDRAAAAAEKGMNLAADIGAADNECEGAMMLGKIAWMRGDYEKAIALSERSVDAARRSGFTFLEAAALCVLGTTYLDISDDLAEKTGEYHSAALEVMERPLGAVMGALVWAELAYCAIQLGGPEQAGEFIQKGLDAPSSPMYLMRPQLLLGSAAISLGGNDAAGARELIGAAREFAEERAMKHYYPMISFFDAMAVADEDPDRAVGGMAKAEELAAAMQMRPLIWQARAFSAQMLDSMGRADEAAAKREGAREMIDEIASLFEDDGLRATFVQGATGKLG